MNKKVIYTCIVGEYDDLRSPSVIRDDWDYICFTDNIKLKNSGIWEIRPIPYESYDNTCLSRFVKLQPHKVLSDYIYSLYMDANVQIIDDMFYDRLEELIDADIKIAHVKHPIRDCIYDDIIACIEQNRVKYFSANRTWKFLRKECYPAHTGLYENNLIFRKHFDPIVVNADDLWWNLFCSFAHRDQFTLCYVYWKLNIRPSLIFTDGKCTRNTNLLKYYYHRENKRSRVTIIYNYIKCRFLKFAAKFIKLIN